MTRLPRLTATEGHLRERDAIDRAFDGAGRGDDDAQVLALGGRHFIEPRQAAFGETIAPIGQLDVAVNAHPLETERPLLVARGGRRLQHAFGVLDLSVANHFPIEREFVAWQRAVAGHDQTQLSARRSATLLSSTIVPATVASDVGSSGSSLNSTVSASTWRGSRRFSGCFEIPLSRLGVEVGTGHDARMGDRTVAFGLDGDL